MRGSVSFFQSIERWLDRRRSVAGHRASSNSVLNRSAAKTRKIEAMMMADCGMGMMVVIWLASFLGLGLLASLIVLVWVAVWRLRRERATPGRASEGEGR